MTLFLLRVFHKTVTSASSFTLSLLCYAVVALVDSEGVGAEGPSPLKNHKHIGFSSNTGPDPLKNRKATKPSFNVGPSSAHQRNAI